VSSGRTQLPGSSTLHYNLFMGFDPKATEARLALSLILSTDMPRLAWDALEAGLDGPAIRRLAALESPSACEVQKLLPRAMEEMHLARRDKAEAALLLAKMRAQEIVRSGADLFQHLRDFEYFWAQADFCSELCDYGTLEDEVHVARYMGQSEQEIRGWVMEKIRKLASG